MSLQIGMSNRRKFLERSVLGVGSVLFLPGLLASCTDHRIPDPNPRTPTHRPIIVGDGIDWNNDARIVVTAGLGMIPEAGEILSALVEIFWPETKEDVWGEVKEKVEELVNQKIDALVYQQVSEDLKGLNNSTILYLNEVKNGDHVSILTQWIVTRNLFAQALPHFQSKGYELLLLPLFAQFANLYLSVLRDGVAFGKDWNRSPGDQQQDITDLKKAITDFTSYTTTTYNTGRANVVSATPANNSLCEPFRTVNRYDRQMTLSVLDFMNTWAYYDVTQYPKGTKVVLTREVYSDPYGSCDKSGNIVITTPVPTKPPTQLTVWAWEQVDAIQVTYPAGSGPGGVTQTPRMGDQPNGSFGGSNEPPYGGIFTIAPNNPLVAFASNTGGWVHHLIFTFEDGTWTHQLGGANDDPNQGCEPGKCWYDQLYGIRDHFVSSIHVNGVVQITGTADCIVVGFEFWADRPAAISAAIRTLYVKSPKEHSAADFAQLFPTLAISDVLITDELKAARQAYWASVQARAKALK